MRLHFTILTLMVASVLCGTVHAQVTARVEYPHNDNYNNEMVMPMGNQGLLLQRFAKKAEGDKRYMQTVYFSNDLKTLYTDSMLVDKNYHIDVHFYENKMNYTVMRNGKGGVIVVAFNPATHRSTVTQSEYTRKGTMRDFNIFGSTMLYNSTEKSIDKVGIINLQNGENHVCEMHFDGVKNKNISVLDNTMIDGVVHALVDVNGELYLVKINRQGQQLSATNLTVNAEEHILSASLSKTGGKYFVTGTFSNNRKNFSQGIYFGEVANDRIYPLKFYNFTDLHNFTDYMSEKSQKRIARKMAKAEAKGKELLLNYNMLNHNILTDGKYYYYLGEAYYPVWRTVVMYGVANTYFVGYQYTHGVLAKFDSQGNMLWDQCFPLKIKNLPMWHKQFISASISGNNVKMMYTTGNKFVSKLVANSDGHVVKDAEVDHLETTDTDEKVRKADSNNDYWYDNNFVVYGTEIVKNQRTGDRRKVFAITKYTVK